MTTYIVDTTKGQAKMRTRRKCTDKARPDFTVTAAELSRLIFNSYDCTGHDVCSKTRVFQLDGPYVEARDECVCVCVCVLLEA